MQDSSQGVAVKDRTWFFRKYSRCFVGADLVTWIIENGFAKTRDEAVFIGLGGCNGRLNDL